MTRLVSLTVGGDANSWQAIGLDSSRSSLVLADVELRVVAAPAGLVSWTIAVEPSFTGPRGDVAIDGIPTIVVDDPGHHRHVESLIRDQRVVTLDHVVVSTDDPDRTCAAIESAIGAEVRRVRRLDNGVEQRFHKLDNTIIEVVSGPNLESDGARLWGMVVSVDDLFALADSLGNDVMSPPKRATQPGRFISTVRGSAGVGVPFAMMTPHVPGLPTH